MTASSDHSCWIADDLVDRPRLSQRAAPRRILPRMRQVWITRTGTPDVLVVKEAPDPTAGKGEVRIRVRASGINFADLMARVGLYPDAPKLPCVVGYEVSGTVDQVGEGVTEVAVGDRVLAMCKFGGYSDVVTVSAGQAIKMPDKMSFEEGAAFPVVYVTAYNMMLWNGHLRPGSSVLIHSAAGGVGLAAIQIARTRGCVILGTASPSKHAFLKELGCQHPIDSNGDYAPAVRAIVGDKGVDLVLDPVGGKSWTTGYELLAPCGRLVAFGLSSAASGNTRSIFHALAQVLSIKKWSPMKLMDDNKTVGGTNMGHLFSRPDLIEPQLVALMAMYDKGELKPHVDRTFPFTEAEAAHQYIHDRKAKGKCSSSPDKLASFDPLLVVPGSVRRYARGMRPRLLTIPISHYGERARWALDWAGVDYEETHHLQMFSWFAAFAHGGRRRSLCSSTTTACSPIRATSPRGRRRGRG